MKSDKRPRFILSRRNQKGQVAVFVALIFQVVFVFFAMLINVGLLVHHKINLQQSTDLAAYYGAMKQAEILNVMAHVNYQIRQAWKLFTWRYRVLGTFGVERRVGQNINPPNAPIMPVGWVSFDQPIVHNSFDDADPKYKCGNGTAQGINFTDVPFACMGHIGFEDWPSPSKGDETFCRIDCGNMAQVPTTIKKLDGVGGFSWGGANIGKAVDAGITKLNNQLDKQCEILGATTVSMLGLYYANYFVDTSNKKKIIQILNKNLALDEESILDVEGNKIITGVKNSLRNNLTEANLSSVNSNPSSIVTYNGIKGKDKELIREMTMYYLNFFIFECSGTNAQSVRPALTNLNNGPGGGLEKDGPLYKAIMKLYRSEGEEVIKIFAQNSEDINTLGYEKNPWYQVYYGVKSTSEPRIPFLPLSKIKLNAISFAKPFGGTIGPWYYNTWSPGSPNSSGAFDSSRMDMNVPAQTAQEAGLSDDLKSLRDSIKVTPNFSLYIGDKKGLSDSKYLGIYQGMLAAQKIPNDNVSANIKISASTKRVSDSTGKRVKASQWPKMRDWSHLTKQPTDPDFDSLAINQDNPNQYENTFMRDIEISVVAPNQFDVANYSIEPNFYQAYGKGKLLNPSGTSMEGLKKLADAVGESSSQISFPYDFGSTMNDKIAGLAREFNVSRQLQVVTELFATGRVGDIPVQNISAAESMFFTFIPRNPAATLTGWTYNDPRKFSEFPEPKNAKSDPYTMYFGSCNDERKANGNESIYSSLPEEDKTQPAVPGNCVTGGRTGYSVKLISSDLVREKTKHKDLGGPGTGSAPIANPVDENFLKF